MQLVPEGTPPAPYLATKVLRRRLQKSTGSPQLLVQLAQPGEKRYARWLDEGLVQTQTPPSINITNKMIRKRRDTVQNNESGSAVLSTRRSLRKHKVIDWHKVLKGDCMTLPIRRSNNSPFHFFSSTYILLSHSFSLLSC